MMNTTPVMRRSVCAGLGKGAMGFSWRIALILQSIEERRVANAHLVIHSVAILVLSTDTPSCPNPAKIGIAAGDTGLDLKTGDFENLPGALSRFRTKLSGIA